MEEKQMKEKKETRSVVNHYEPGSNCQVFNGNNYGCVFAMPSWCEWVCPAARDSTKAHSASTILISNARELKSSRRCKHQNHHGSGDFFVSCGEQIRTHQNNSEQVRTL